jgi:para-nitrobenzyl esterase
MGFMRKAIGLFAVTLFAAVCTDVAIAQSTQGLPANSTVVATQFGLVAGTAQDGIASFKGVPYAAPPVGSLRWREPQQPRPWHAVRAAREFGAACMQKGMFPDDMPREPVSEDCLTLNIWTPARGTKLPVMVWIHGGSLTNGSGAVPIYDGANLARLGVVVVTINYRLGVFGFLAHAALGRESPHHVSGNYGFLDQIAALRWVHNNIAGFGGDPSRVTVFGQSSGSIAISALMTSPLTSGLFQRAIGESGGLFEPLQLAPNFQLSGAEKNGLALAERLRATSLSALRGLPAETLLAQRFSAQPVIDGYVLPRAPYDAYHAGVFQRIPILIGSNADEGRPFIDSEHIDRANYRYKLNQDFPPLLVTLLASGPGSTDDSARAAAAAFNGDMRFHWDMLAWARLHAEQAQPVFLYRFAHVPPYPEGSLHARWRAGHGMEMRYVFDNLDKESYPWTATDRALARTLSLYWTNFAKNGDPNGTGLPRWPSFSVQDEAQLLIGDRIAATPVGESWTLRKIDLLYWSVRHWAIAGAVAITTASLVVVLLMFAVVALLRRRSAA